MLRGETRIVGCADCRNNVVPPHPVLTLLSMYFPFSNYPIIIEIVDTREKLEAFLPYLEKNVTNGLVILEDSEYLVTDYTRKRKAERTAIEAQQNQQ